MTDKAKERIKRACLHMIMLRVAGYEGCPDGEWLNIWQCEDCGWQMELAVLLEEAEA